MSYLAQNLLMLLSMRSLVLARALSSVLNFTRLDYVTAISLLKSWIAALTSLFITLPARSLKVSLYLFMISKTVGLGHFSKEELRSF